MVWERALRIMAITAFIAIMLSGCATQGTPSDMSAPDRTGNSEYVIGAGDQLQIYVRNNDDLSVTIPVRPDGKISVPMLRDVEAAGLTPSELADDLEAGLSEFIREPTVTVIVTSFVGTYSNMVRIIGQAVQPQSIPFRDGMTVLDAVIQVGGLTRFAAGNRAKLIRGTASNNRTFSLRLDDLLNDGDIRHNHALRPGDILVIPEAMF